MSIEAMLYLLARAALTTIQAAFLISALALVLSFVGGLASLSRHTAIRLTARTYVHLIRGIPALVQVFFFYFVLPHVGIRLPSLLSGVLAMGLVVGAYGSEIVRTTIQSVDRGQREAAIALNMDERLLMRRIILPQALIAMVPLFGNELILTLKSTSLLSVVALTELTFEAKNLVQRTASPLLVYSLLLVIYFAMCYPLSRVVAWIEHKVARSFGARSRFSHEF